MTGVATPVLAAAAVGADAQNGFQAVDGWQVVVGGGSNKINWYVVSSLYISPPEISLTGQSLGDLEYFSFVISGSANQPFVRIYTLPESDGADVSWYRSSILAYFPTAWTDLDHQEFVFDTTTDDYAEPIGANNGFTRSNAATLAAIRCETLGSISLQTSSGSVGGFVLHEVRVKFVGELYPRVIYYYDGDLARNDNPVVNLLTTSTVTVGTTSDDAALIIAPDQTRPVQECGGWRYENTAGTAGKKINWYFFSNAVTDVSALSTAGKRISDLESLEIRATGSASDIYLRFYTVRDAGSNFASWYKSSLLIRFPASPAQPFSDSIITFDLTQPISTYAVALGANNSFSRSNAANINDIGNEFILSLSLQTGSGSVANFVVTQVELKFKGEAAARILNLNNPSGCEK